MTAWTRWWNGRARRLKTTHVTRVSCVLFTGAATDWMSILVKELDNILYTGDTRGKSM